MINRDYYEDTNARTDAWHANNVPRPTGGDGVSHMASVVAALPCLRGRMLDIGCQTGSLIERVADRFDSCYGIDIGDYRDYWKRIGNAQFMVHDLDAEPLPFPDKYFHLVTCFMTLEHVFDVFGLVAEIARVTAEGKYAIIEVPNIAYFKHIILLFRGQVPRTGALNFPFNRADGWDGQHLHSFTLRELKWLCNEYGLRTIRHGTRGRFPRFRRVWPSMLYSSLVLTLRKQGTLENQDQ
jgi:SAM-dependent methyltransferase